MLYRTFAHRASLFVSSIAVSTALFACGGMADESTSNEDTGEVAERIINGTPSNTAETMGWVHVVQGGYGCSGTLLRNDMVLTARHCVTTDGQSGGPVNGTTAAYQVNIGTQYRGVYRVIAAAPSLDVALLQTSLFTMNGNGFDWNRQIYSGTNASLVNMMLDCYGYGKNTFTAGGGTLRYAALQVTSEQWPYIVFSTTNGQIQWEGDSGSTCLSGPYATGVDSLGLFTPPNGPVTGAEHIGPQAYRGWANEWLWGLAAASVQTGTASNISGSSMRIDDPDANANPVALIQVTANFNPVGSSGIMDNHTVGVRYDSTAARWSIYNQDGAAMPVGAAFNVSVGGNSGYAASIVHTTSSSNISFHTTRLDIPGVNGNPNALLIATPNGTGAANNHAIGVAYDATVSRWTVVNEDFASMPANVKFNVRVGTQFNDTFVQSATASNIMATRTYIDNVTLNGQPSAQVFVTHNYNPGGMGASGMNHPLGVRYDASMAKWAVFTEDNGVMPIGATFNVMIRP